jgi:hypothetical protein
LTTKVCNVLESFGFVLRKVHLAANFLNQTAVLICQKKNTMLKQRQTKVNHEDVKTTGNSTSAIGDSSCELCKSKLLIQRKNSMWQQQHN